MSRPSHMAVFNKQHVPQQQVPQARCWSQLPGSFMKCLLSTLPSADRLSLFQTCRGLRDQVLQHANSTILALVFKGQQLDHREWGQATDYMVWPYNYEATMVHCAKACELCKRMHVGVRPHHITLQTVQQGGCHTNRTAPSDLYHAELLIRDMSGFLHTRLYCITEITLQGVVLSGLVPLWMPGTCPNLQHYHLLGCRVSAIQHDEHREWRPQCEHLTHFTLHSTLIPHTSLEALQRELMLLPSLTSLDITVSPLQDGFHRLPIVSAFGSQLRQLRAAAAAQTAFPGHCVPALKTWGEHLTNLTTLDIGSTMWVIGQEEAMVLWYYLPSLKHLTAFSLQLTAPLALEPPSHSPMGTVKQGVPAMLESICLTMPLLSAASLAYLPSRHLTAFQLLPDKRLVESEPSLTMQLVDIEKVAAGADAMKYDPRAPVYVDIPGITQLRLSPPYNPLALEYAQKLFKPETWKQLTSVQLRNVVIDLYTCLPLSKSMGAHLKRLRLYDVTFAPGPTALYLLSHNFAQVDFVELRGSSKAHAPKESTVRELFEVVKRPITLLVQSSWRKRVEAGVLSAACSQPIKLLFTDSNTYW